MYHSSEKGEDKIGPAWFSESPFSEPGDLPVLLDSIIEMNSKEQLNIIVNGILILILQQKKEGKGVK